MAEMAGFLVGVRGELTEEQTKALALAGIAVETPSASDYGGQIDPMRTHLHVIANDESEAKTKVAKELNVDAAELTITPYANGSR
jgi:hypothetical protein